MEHPEQYPFRSLSLRSEGRNSLATHFFFTLSTFPFVNTLNSIKKMYLIGHLHQSVVIYIDVHFGNPGICLFFIFCQLFYFYLIEYYFMMAQWVTLLPYTSRVRGLKFASTFCMCCATVWVFLPIQAFYFIYKNYHM